MRTVRGLGYRFGCAPANDRDKHHTFSLLSFMEVSARSGYQMGKSPLLPLLALQMGAGPEMIGLIVSVSTMTGMLSKPFFGQMSDALGRRPLLWMGSLLFALVPFGYLFVQTDAQLLAIRVVHGLATSIYGPVIAASIADLFPKKADSVKCFGWYEAVRSTGYIIGPLIGGLALTMLDDPRRAYLFSAAMGIVSIGPLIILSLARNTYLSTGNQTVQAFKSSFRRKGGRREPWILIRVFSQTAVQLNFCTTVLTRFIRNFWPVSLVAVHSPATLGLVLAFMVAASLLTSSNARMIHARFSRRTVYMLCTLFFAVGSVSLFVSTSLIVHVVGALIVGIGEGLVSPLAYAEVLDSNQGNETKGQRAGYLGSVKNAGKVVGPLVAGFLLLYTSSLVIILCALVIMFLIVGSFKQLPGECAGAEPGGLS